MDTFGARLRAARLASFERTGRELKQGDIGAEIGLTSQAVSQWENDLTTPVLPSVPRIAELLGVTPEWLAWGRGERYVAQNAPQSVEDAPQTNRAAIPTRDTMVPRGKAQKRPGKRAG